MEISKRYKVIKYLTKIFNNSKEVFTEYKKFLQILKNGEARRLPHAVLGDATNVSRPVMYFIEILKKNCNNEDII